MFYSVKIFLFPSSWLVAGGRACNAEIVVVGGCYRATVSRGSSLPLRTLPVRTASALALHETEIDWRGGRRNRETRLGPRPAILQPISTNICHGESFSLDSAGDVTSGRDEKSDQYLEWS